MELRAGVPEDGTAEVKKPTVRLDALKSLQPAHQFAKTVLTHSYVCYRSRFLLIYE